jgi:membrane-bound lytic murein transglycosylase D
MSSSSQPRASISSRVVGRKPEDLVYLALAESAMNPRIVSHAGAAGLWQFMPKAGEAYGLRVDKHVDERLDPHRSTEAAVRFLKDLHSRFGRWELAMAAYNMGHGGLLTSIRKYNTNDFWELSRLEAGIPYETALYVPKIVALAFVARNKEAFGLQELQLDPAEPFDMATAPGTGPSAGVAAAPNGAKAKPTARPVAAKSAEPAREEPTVETSTYTLRWGESLEVVAASFGLTESKLRALNNLKDPVPPRPGTKVLVPKAKGPNAQTDALVAVVPAAVSAAPGSGKKQVFYEVVWGDKLDEVARVLGVTADDLAQWNNIDRSANLHGKMVLQAFVASVPSSADVRVTSAADAKVLVAGTPAFFEHFESKNGRSRALVTVAAGDTMKSLAKKHGLTLGMMERINHRSRDADLKPGEQLVVYTRKAGPLLGQAPAATQPALTPSAPAPIPGADDIYAIDDRPSDVDGG